MAYKLKLKENLKKGVRRIATAQLERTLASPPTAEHRALWVHETRKALKRTRALLRLVRSGFEPGLWKAEDAALRDIARLLSPMRDRDILRQTLAKLVEGAEPALVAAVGRIEPMLLHAPPPDGALSLAPEAILDEAIRQLHAARDRLAEVHMTGQLPTVIAAGIEAGQRRGSKALRRLAEAPTDEHLHDLRKAVQTCWRQTSLVQAAWPEVLAARVEVARSLAAQLGEIQDLSVLAAAARRAADSAARRRDAARLVAACQRRQDALRALAVPAAERLFADPPRSAGIEVARCWPAAISIAAAASLQRRAAETVATDAAQPADDRAARRAGGKARPAAR